MIVTMILIDTLIVAIGAAWIKVAAEKLQEETSHNE